MRFLNNFNVMWYIESNIRAPVLLTLLNSLRKGHKCAASLAFYLFFSTCLIHPIKYDYSCKILCIKYEVDENCDQNLDLFPRWIGKHGRLNETSVHMR